MTADVSAEPLLYTADEAADRIGGSTTAYWLKIQARRGTIPCHRGPRRAALFSEEECRQIADLMKADSKGRTALD